MTPQQVSNKKFPYTEVHFGCFFTWPFFSSFCLFCCKPSVLHLAGMDPWINISSHLISCVCITFVVLFTHTHMFNIYFASLLHRARLEKEKDLESEGPQMCPWAKTAWKTVRVHTLPFFMCSYSAFFVCVHVKMMDSICSSNSENDGQYLQFKFWKWWTIFAV